MSEEVKQMPADVQAMVDSESVANTMLIDKIVFDNTILPLLIGNGLGLSLDERWDNIKNIWINYYNNTDEKKGIIPNTVIRTAPNGSRVEEKSKIPEGGMYATMSIVDNNGNIIAVTPPLMSVEPISGSTDMFLEYKNTSNVNKPLAGRELSKNLNARVDRIKNVSNDWGAFLDYYIPTHSENSISDIDANNESNDGDSLLTEY